MDILLLLLVFASGMILGLSYGAYRFIKLGKTLTFYRKAHYDCQQELSMAIANHAACKKSLKEIQTKVKEKQTIKRVGRPPLAVVTPTHPVGVKIAPPSRRVVREDDDSSILLGVTAVAAGMAIANSFDDTPTSDFSNVSSGHPSDISSGGGGDFAGGGASEEY